MTRMIYCGYCGKEHQENSGILTEHQRLLGDVPHIPHTPRSYQLGHVPTRDFPELLADYLVIKEMLEPPFTQHDIEDLLESEGLTPVVASNIFDSLLESKSIVPA